VLSEEAVILVAVASALVLLALGVLELIWPTRPRQARRARVEPAPAGFVAGVSPRPPQSILPRRLIESSSSAQPGFAFPPPADYVPPPLPREDVRPEPASPVRPIGVVRPTSPVEDEPALPPPGRSIEPPAAPSEPVYIAPPAVDDELPVAPPTVNVEPPLVEVEPRVVEIEPRAIENPRVEAEPYVFEREALRGEPPTPSVEPEPRPLSPEPTRLEATPQPEPEPPRFEPEPPMPEPPAAEPGLPSFEPEPHTLEPEPPLGLEVEAPRLEPPEPIQQPGGPFETFRRRRRSKISPHARPHRVLRPAKVDPSSYEVAVPDPTTTAPVESPARPWSSEGITSGVDARMTRDSALVERCFALYQEKQFADVLAVGEPGLAALRNEPGASRSRDAAALWSVVGLAKQALGDDDGAHTALAASIDAASETDRPTYRRHLATHALDAAQARLARASSHDPADRMAVIRTAIAWAERGLAAVPPDAALHDARETAHEALWHAYEQAATTLVQRQEFGAARRILHEALEDPKLPAVRAAEFRGLFSGTFGGEIGQLTALAILSMQDGRESEALGVLERAEDLLAAIPADTLASSRRDEIEQRLWWGYAELGSRRLDAGDYEEALDPIVHALRFTSIGPERQAETRAAVVRALEGIEAVRALSIRRLAEAGNRDEAIVAAGELNALVKRTLEVGVTEDELGAAVARVRRLCEELGMDARA